MSRSITCGIAIMAKAPIPHYCKTRLVPHLGARGAAGLQRQLLRKTLQTAVAAELGPVTLFCAPDIRHGLFTRLRSEHGVGLHRQTGANLGARMLDAVRRQLAMHDAVIVLGTDCPALRTEDLRHAAGRLGQVDHVIQPAEDGGYVLLASRRYRPTMFRNIHWGGAGVMQATRQRLLRLGDSWEETRNLWDVDEWDDYLRALKQSLIKRHSP